MSVFRWFVLMMGVYCLGVAYAKDAFIAPEPHTGFHAKPLVFDAHQMVVTNNVWATKAALKILAQGGNAIDAAIASAFVLGLTEPQSSGLGGGGFALTYQEKEHQLSAYDGREIAPSSAKPSLFMDAHQNPMPFEVARLSPKAVGIPGEVALLMKLHQQEGHLKWRVLLKPAIDLAEQGFPLSRRLRYLLIKNQDDLLKNRDVKRIYFKPNGAVKALGETIQNVAYAKTLTLLAQDPSAFYQGAIASDVVSTVNKKAQQDFMRLQDFHDYRVIKDQALCGDFRINTVCTTPFGSGGVSVLQLLGIYAKVSNDIHALDAHWMHEFLEASQLTYADRNQYVADGLLMEIPLKALITPEYLETRMQLIRKTAQPLPVMPGNPMNVQSTHASDERARRHGTTSLAIVDAKGNAISMTLTIEHEFGSHLWVDGFFLNNELTDFSFVPRDAEGRDVLNQVTPLKRPRSAIAPIMIFDEDHHLSIITGSPGGAPIICYVAKNIIELIDFKKNPKQSAASGNLCAMNQKPFIESHSELVDFIPALEKRGHRPKVIDLNSGLVTIQRIKKPKPGWWGAADPRREGVALGL